MFIIDGMHWDVPIGVERTATMQEGDASGTLLDGSYFNDVMGTYLSYSVTLAIPPSRYDDYDALYEILTDPVRDHEVTLPYNQTHVTFRGMITDVSDTYVRVGDGGTWRGTSFTVTSTEPNKSMLDSEVVASVDETASKVAFDNGTMFVRSNGRWEIYAFAGVRKY